MEALVATILGVGGAVAAVMFIWALIRWAKQVSQRVDAAWAQAAAQVSGAFQRRAGPWYNRTRRLDAQVDGTAVLVDHYTVSTGKSSQTFTRLRANVPHAGTLRLKVFPKHLFSGLSRALGFQDVITGDAQFDEDFVVKASDERLARSWLTPEVREAIRRSAKYGFSIKNGKLTAQLGQLDDNADRLAAAIRATAVLADTGQTLVDRWGHFASRQRGSLAMSEDGRVRIEIDERSTPLRIDVAKDESERTVTRVRARVLDPDAERYELAAELEGSDGELCTLPSADLALPGPYVVASSAPEQTARRLNASVRDRLPALAPLRIESDGEDVTVVLPGMETDEERLAEALEVASTLAAETGKGAYR